MLDWTNKVITDKGIISLRDLATKKSGKTKLDYHNRYFTAEEKTDRRFVKQAKNFRIYPNEEFLVLNEQGVWKRLEYLYFHGSTDFYFKIYFSAPGLKKSTDHKTNEFIIKALPRQQFLINENSRLRWKKASEFTAISNEFLKLQYFDLNYAEYMGIVKTKNRTQLVSIKAENSLGVCIDPGVVALSST